MRHRRNLGAANPPMQSHTKEAAAVGSSEKFGGMSHSQQLFHHLSISNESGVAAPNTRRRAGAFVVMVKVWRERPSPDRKCKQATMLPVGRASRSVSSVTRVAYCISTLPIECR